MAKLTKAEQKTLLDSTIYQNDNEEIKAANHNGMLTDFIDSGMNETEPTIQENLNANNKKIVNLTDPTNDQDASTKKYVDDKQLDNGSGTTVDGNAIDWHGPLTRAATQIDIAPGQTLQFLGTDSTDFVKQLFQDSSIELISIADDVDAANNIGQFAKTGIAEVLSKPGILLRTVTKDLAVGATVILNQDGIISVGAPAISPSTAFSHFKFLHDYSAKWDALSAGEKDLIITSFGYQNTNFLSKLDTADQTVASNVTFQKEITVQDKINGNVTYDPSGETGGNLSNTPTELQTATKEVRDWANSPLKVDPFAFNTEVTFDTQRSYTDRTLTGNETWDFSGIVAGIVQYQKITTDGSHTITLGTNGRLVSGTLGALTSGNYDVYFTSFNTSEVQIIAFGDTVLPPFVNTYSVLLNATNTRLDSLVVDDFKMGNGVDTDTPFSISFWFKAGTGGGVVLSINDPNDTSRGIYIFVNGISGSMSMNLYSLTGTFSIDDTLNHKNGAWGHYCFTYDGSKTVSGVKMYYQGTLISSPTESGTYSVLRVTAGTKLMAGVQEVSASPTFYGDGNLDEMVIYKNLELSAIEVQTIFNSGDPDDVRLQLPDRTINISGYYRFENNAFDSHTSGNNLTEGGSITYPTEVP